MKATLILYLRKELPLRVDTLKFPGLYAPTIPANKCHGTPAQLGRVIARMHIWVETETEVGGRLVWVSYRSGRPRPFRITRTVGF